MSLADGRTGVASAASGTPELELSLLSRQCLGECRFDAAAAMDAEITAWQSDRDARI